MRPEPLWITGIGAVTAFGEGAGALAEPLANGRSAVRPFPGCSADAAQCDDPQAGHGARRLDRSARLFLGAAEEAWLDASLPPQLGPSERGMVIEGSSLGVLPDALAEHSKGGPARPSRLVRYLTGAGGTAFGQRHGITGPVLHLSAGSASAAMALHHAALLLRAGAADIAVVGGGEAPLHPDVLATFEAARLLASPLLCRPFDEARAGTVLGEGGGAVVIERAAHARRRGARPRALLLGVGIGTEAAGFTAPDPTGVGVATAIRGALKNGRADAKELGWIKAHGTGTVAGDAAEYQGLRAVLHAGVERIPITSLKPAFGHCLGASAAVEMTAAIVALESALVPACVNTRTPDSRLAGVRVALSAERCEGSAVLLLTEGFGGRAVAALIARG